MTDATGWLDLNCVLSRFIPEPADVLDMWLRDQAREHRDTSIDYVCIDCTGLEVSQRKALGDTLARLDNELRKYVRLAAEGDAWGSEFVGVEQRCPECAREAESCDWCPNCDISLKCAQSDKGGAASSLYSEDGRTWYRVLARCGEHKPSDPAASDDERFARCNDAAMRLTEKGDPAGLAVAEAARLAWGPTAKSSF
jgi:hypothetical protein